MLNRKVLKMQDSLYVAIPKQLCSLIGIKKGDTLCIEYVNEKIIIAPVQTAQARTDASQPSAKGSAST